MVTEGDSKNEYLVVVNGETRAKFNFNGVGNVQFTMWDRNYLWYIKKIMDDSGYPYNDASF